MSIIMTSTFYSKKIRRKVVCAKNTSYEILTMNILLLREVFGNDDFLKNVFENIGKAESFAHWYYNSKGSAFCPQWNWEIIKYPLNRLAELQRVVQGFLN